MDFSWKKKTRVRGKNSHKYNNTEPARINMPHEIDTIVLTTQFLNNSDYSLNKDLELERSTFLFDEKSI